MNDAKKYIFFRIYLVYVLTLVFALLIIGKIFQIQVVQGKEWREISVEKNFGWVDIKAKRGNIISADGLTICQTRPNYDIFMDPLSDGISDTLFLNNIKALGDSLQKHFGLNSREFVSKIKGIRQKTAPINRHYPIVKEISWEEYMLIRSFPIFNKGRLRGGLISYENYVTDYPYGTLAKRTIGNANEKKSMKFGINGCYDSELTGTVGKQYVQRVRGTGWYPVSAHNAKRIEPQNGYDIITTINVRMQDIVENELKNRIIKHKADSACVVLMDVKTGHIKAIANLKQLSDGRIVEEYNYAVSSLFDPGSTMKLPILMAAFEDGHIKINDTIDCENGKVKMYDKTYEDVRKGGYGKISVKDIFKESSNVGVVKIVEKYYNARKGQSNTELEKTRQKLVNKLYDMGLNQKVNTEIEHEPFPVIRNSGFSHLSLLQMSIGYEISMTPLQMLTFYNAVANDGKMVKPMFVTEIRDGSKVVKKLKPTVLKKQIASKRTISFANEILQAVVKEGTGKSIRNTVGYEIAGKTGTAKLLHPKLGYNHNQYYISSFAGYFPVEQPKYSIIVIIFNPSEGGYYGGAVAAPVVKEIADKIIAMEIGIRSETDIECANNPFIPCIKGKQNDVERVWTELGYNAVIENPNAQWITMQKNEDISIFKHQEIEIGVMPDVIGMSIKDAVVVLENLGVKVKFNGIGNVIKQSVNPGEPIFKDKLIRLELSI